MTPGDDAGAPGQRPPARATPEEARGLLDAAREDPAMATALREAYRGRHCVLDALWWRAHPSTPCPSGAADPAEERAAAASLAYSREGRPGDLASLASFDERLATDAARLDEAIREVRGRPAEGAARGGTDAAGSTPPRRRRRLALAGAALLVVIASGLAVSASQGLRLPGSSGAVAGDPSPAWLGPPDVFARDQVAGDSPDAILPDDYEAATVRRLLATGEGDGADAVGDYQLFGARTADGGVCLVLVFADGTISSSCVSEAEFDARGVGVTTNVYRHSRASLGTLVLVPHTVTWSRDGIAFATVSPDRGP